MTHKQEGCLEYMVNNPTASASEVAENTGVCMNSVYKWLHNPEFQAEYKRRLRERFNSLEGVAIEAMKNLILQNDFKASKYILDALDYAPAQKVDANVNTTTITVSIEDDGDAGN